MRVFVTGGAGYIGSHTCVELLNAGHDVVIFDNFCNSSPNVIPRIEQISGRRVDLAIGDIRNQFELESVLAKHKPDAVIHFAGLKAVGESVAMPLDYYDVNLIGTHRLISAMNKCNINKLIFSSSATVYGNPQKLPIDENHPLAATNPYGRTKLFIEEMLRDFHQANSHWQIAILRYFNPVGAHESGMIGEDPQGIPNNLMPYVAQVAVGEREYLNVWGNDYPTHDGTGVRDYIHVVDLALGHISALETFSDKECFAVNLGTGIGYSVIDVIRAFESASSQRIFYKLAQRRTGDIAICYANPSLAKQRLNWQAQFDLLTMCQDHWRWQKNNPRGYT